MPTNKLSEEKVLAMDGTLCTVLIYGVGYADAVTRIKAWMSRSRIGPVLVTDDEMGELLLPDFAARSRRVDLEEARPEIEPER